MTASINIRRSSFSDIMQIVGLVREVTSEQYGHLVEGDLPTETDPKIWMKGWVAEEGAQIIGVGLAVNDYIDDLWVRQEYRGQEIGSGLLSRLEMQIKNDGHTTAQLRVVADNKRARRFYVRHGWTETRFYPHETIGIDMVDMQKDLTLS